MKNLLFGSNFKFLWILFIFIPLQISAQEKCFAPESVEKIIASINSPKTEENKKLRDELMKMVENQEKANKKAIENWETDKSFDAEAKKIGKENAFNLCRILSENGWLTKESVTPDGFNAFLYIIRSIRDLALQREFLPVLTAATQKGLIAKENLASLIDKIRLGSGYTQIFGTQSAIKDEIAYLYPLTNEEKVDEWRKIYEMPPLKTFFKEMEVYYQTPVLKMPRTVDPTNLKLQPEKVLTKEENPFGAAENDEEEVVNVETKLVNLNVRVLSKDAQSDGNLNLQKEDFEIFENGQKQEISFFSTTDAAFDLILMLDLSGSTVEKRGVIEKSARRFVEAARPSDRIAIVSFTHTANLVSDFTQNKQILYQKIKDLDDTGGSKIWDAIKFTYDNLITNKKENRRKAIILMTDGVDNSLVQSPTILYVGRDKTGSLPSEITFNELMETIKQNEAAVFSIYVDNEYGSDAWTKKAYRQAKRTLKMFADESGGEYYYARKLKDLNGIYEQIINDLNKVYSLSYEPQNDLTANSWREITVKIKDRPNLMAKTKSGYFAK